MNLEKVLVFFGKTCVFFNWKFTIVSYKPFSILNSRFWSNECAKEKIHNGYEQYDQQDNLCLNTSETKNWLVKMIKDDLILYAVHMVWHVIILLWPPIPFRQPQWLAKQKWLCYRLCGHLEPIHQRYSHRTMQAESSLIHKSQRHT